MQKLRKGERRPTSKRLTFKKCCPKSGSEKQQLLIREKDQHSFQELRGGGALLVTEKRGSLSKGRKEECGAFQRCFRLRPIRRGKGLCEVAAGSCFVYKRKEEKCVGGKNCLSSNPIRTLKFAKKEATEPPEGNQYLPQEIRW